MRQREKRIWVRLNDREFADLEQKRNRTGLTREAYIRAALESSAIRAAPPSEYGKLLLALSRIGNNLNQIATVANSIRFINKKELEETNRALREIMHEMQQSFSVSPPQKKQGGSR